MKKKHESKRKFPPLAPRKPSKPTSLRDLELADLLDVPALQAMMDAFFALEHIGIGIVDTAGKVLVATGWQDICSKFHRVHPKACKHCLESDTVLSAGVEPGAFKTYRCPNHLWDSATPIVVGGRHMGNLFLGQFFFDDEEPDADVFRAQARQYGFDEAEYLAALGRVPRWSREKVARTMEFYARFAGHISELGYRNFQAARMLAERKQAEERLKQDDALLRLAGKTVAFGGWTADLAENRVVWSDEVAAIHDMPAGSSPSVEEAIAFYAPEWRDRIARAFQACAAKGVAYDEELEIVTAQGRRRWVRTNGVPVRDEKGRIVRVQGSFQNITERKLREEEHAFASRLIALVGAPGDLHERLAELTRVLQEWSKCEAVGIRLRNGDDFPYFETRGFPPEFVRGESRLCADGPDGHVLRDGAGRPELDCLCGDVLCGRGDPAKPYFTARGSFWTNSTTGLLAAATESDRRAHARNRCNGEGYESVALIALRTDRQTLGLLQFNDLRPGRFAPGMIANLERIADALAGALARREVEERLRLHAQLLDSVRESVVASDAEGRIVYWSRGAESLYGYAAEEVLGKPYRNFAGAIEPPDEAAFRTEILAKGSWRGEHLQRRRNGETVWTSTVVFPVKDGLGRPAGFVGIDLDINDRKQTELSLKQSERTFQNLVETINDIVFSLGPDGRITYVSPAARTLTGYDPGEIIGTPFAEWIDPRDHEALLAAWNEVLAGRARPGEYRIRTRSGETRWVRTSSNRMLENGVVAGIHGVMTDITERKQAEEATRRSETRYRTFIEAGSDLVFLKDDAFRYLISNGANNAFLDKPEADVIGRTDFDLMPQATAERCRAGDHDALAQGKPVTAEETVGGKTYQTLKFPVPLADGRTGVGGTIRDITRQKQAEEEINRLSKFPSENPSPVLRVDRAGRILFANKAGAPILNFWKREIGEIVPAGWLEKFTGIFAAGRDAEVEMDCAGQIFSCILTPVPGEEYANLYGRDITAHKRAEETLRQSEEKFAKAFQTSPYAITLTRVADGRFVDVNAAFFAITGYTRAETLADTSFGLGLWIRPEDRESMVADLRAGRSVSNREYSFRRKDGGLVPTLFSAQLIQLAGGPCILSSISDITERKRAEEALSESEQRHRDYLTHSPHGIFVADENGRLVQVNPAACRITGYSENELLAMSVAELHGEFGREGAVGHFQTVLREGKAAGELQFRTKSGELRWWHVAAVKISATRFLGFCNDVTERKRAETALREAWQITESIIDTVPMRVFWKDRNLVYLGCNKMFARDAGFSDPQDLVGKDDRQMAWRAQAELYRADDRRVIESGRPKLLFEEPQTTPDGKTLVLLTSKIPLRDAQGEITGVLGTYMDITERKQAEEKLRAVELRLRDIATHIPGVVYQLAVNRKGFFEVPFMSAGCETLFGRAVEGLDYASLWFDRMPPEDLAALRKSLAAAAKRMEAWSMEFRIALADGSFKWLRGSANPRRLQTGGLLWNGVLLDITGLKQTEQALREREAFQNLLMDTIPSPVFYKDRQGRYLGFNKAFETFYGKSKEELVGKSVFDIAPPDLAKIYHEKDLELLEKIGTQIYEAPMQDVAGNRRDVVFHKASIVDEYGEITGLVGILLDITERKRAEEKVLRESALSNTIIDSIPGTFYMLDEAGTYVRWSAYQRDEIVGKPEDQIAGFPALATIHPDDREIVRGRIASVLATGAVEVVEGRVLLRGGPDFRWLLMTGRRMMIDGRPHLVGIGIDITERKRVEAEAAKQLEELRRWQTVTLGREGRIAELKREVNALAARLGTPPPYPSAEAK